jgi:PAS domain S-box-containing protein
MPREVHLKHEAHIDVVHWTEKALISAAKPMRANVTNFAKSLLLVLGAWAATSLLWPYMHPTTVAMFYIAVAIASWCYGKLAGAFATMVSVLYVTYYFTPPVRSFKVEGSEVLYLAIFLTIAFSVSYASASRKSLIERLESERRRLELAQLELASKEARWRALAESMPNLIWTCRADGAVEYLSPQWRTYTGLIAARQAGYRWLTAIHPDDREVVIQRWEEAVATRIPFETVSRIKAANGQYGWFKMKAVPVSSQSAFPTHWVGTCTDISDLREFDPGTLEASAGF